MDPNFLRLFIKKTNLWVLKFIKFKFLYKNKIKNTKKMYGTVAMFPKMERKHISLDIF